MAGIARDSCVRRRSRKVWAPAHKNFLVKIFIPPFNSRYKNNLVEMAGIEPASKEFGKNHLQA